MVESDKLGNPSLMEQGFQYLKEKTPRKDVFIQNIHRLDRPVSGIVLFAKKKSALKELSQQFEKRKVTKTYIAATKAFLGDTKGKLSHWLVKDTLNKKAVIYNEQVEHSQPVGLLYRLMNKLDEGYLWEISLLTGKYHQIRAQLSAAGAPIVGDALYGSDVAYVRNAIGLHAWKLKFFHPAEGSSIEIEAPLPKGFGKEGF